MTLWVPGALSALALVIVVVSAARRQARAAQLTMAREGPRFLIHAINEGLCTGCEACIAVCPTNVLELVGHKSRVERFDDCVQCEACARACPTRALVMHYRDEEPPPLILPELDAYFQTTVPGQYLIGEASGKPLVKNGANLGRAVVEHMVRDGLTAERGGVDVVIVGSGPAGLSAALTCIRHGLSHVVLEKEHIMASTVARYPVGKPFMAEPRGIDNLSFLPVYDTRKEELIATWKQLVARAGVDLRTGEAVESVSRDDGGFHIVTTRQSYRARRVVLAIGTRGKPRTLGIPGEHLPMVHSHLDDPAEFAGRRVLVVGGGDSALEAALALRAAGAATALAYRGRAFNRAKAPNRDAIEAAARAGSIRVAKQFSPRSISAERVELDVAGTVRSLRVDAVFVLIGADLPVKWLSRLGVGFVERPHHHDLGDTEARVRALVADARPCPTEVAAALARLQGVEPRRRRDGSVTGLWLGVQRARATSARWVDSVVSRIGPPRSPPRRRRPAATPMPRLSTEPDTEPFVPITWEPAVEFDDSPTMVAPIPRFD